LENLQDIILRSLRWIKFPPQNAVTILVKGIAILVIFSSFLCASVAFGDERALVEVEREAVQRLTSEELGEFSKLVPELKAAKLKAGLKNLSSLSMLFLQIGEKSCLSAPDSCRFFIDTALELSPTDPAVSARCGELESGISLNLFFRSLKNITNSPVMLSKWIVLGSLGLLTIFTLIFALWGLYKICRVERRGAFHGSSGVLYFAFLAFAGLPFGILPTIACWLVLSFIGYKSIKKEAFFFLALVLGWGLVLPIAETVSLNLKRGEEISIAQLLSPLQSSSIQEVGQSPDPFSNLAIGTSQFMFGNYVEAKNRFDAVLGSTGSKRLRRTALARRGAVELSMRDFEAAERSLESAAAMGSRSFEIVQNLALVKAGKADLEAQRTLMAELQELDDQRFRRESVELAVLLEPIPFMEFWSRYLQPPEIYIEGPLAVEPPASLYLRDNLILNSLVSIGGPLGLLAVLILSLALAVIPKRRLA